MNRRSLTFRLVAAAGLWTVAALLAGGFLLSLLFRNYVEDTMDERLSVLLENLIATTEVTASGKLALLQTPVEPRFDQPYSGWYWQISRKDAPPIRSRSLWDQALYPDLNAPLPEGARHDGLGPDNQALRLSERDITLPGSDAVYRFSVAAERSEIDRDVRLFNRALIWALGALGAGLVGAVIVQVRFGLRPLRDVGRALSDIRSGRAERLEGAFPSEIMPLTKEINTLLDHNAATVERARTHVGNLAHALKTPLTVLTNEAGGASSELAEKVRSQADIMRRHVDHYLVRARTAATGRVLGSRTAIEPVAEDLFRTLARIHQDRGIDGQFQGDPSYVFRGERQDLEEMLGNLMDNAFKWAKSMVRVTASRQGENLSLAIEDDGPGVSPDRREAIFGRGKRLDESVPGSGLGLAIVRDMAELCGGSVSLGDSALGGLKATLVLPSADRA